MLSDFLSAKDESLEITAELVEGRDGSKLERLAADRSEKGSDAALWMLLLLRLTTVTTDERLELRNSAIQTLLRIFDAYGDRLSSEAWFVCIKAVIFQLLSSLEEELKAAEDDDVGAVDRQEWHGTAVVVLNGISSLLANYLDVLTTHPAFNDLWRELLGHLATLLDFQVLDINTATFKALGHVVSQTGHDKKLIFNETTVEFAWDLWSRGIPASKSGAGISEDNQNCLVAYVAAFCEVYKLIQNDLTVERVKRMLTLLRATVKAASVSNYVLDVEYATPLQTQILAAVQMIRTDVNGVPSAMIHQVSEFITLAYDEDRSVESGGSKRTYVAMSKASMKILQTLILAHASDKAIYTSGALATALSALYRPIALKYGFSVVTKSVSPWRLATTTALEVSLATLAKLDPLDIPRQKSQAIWAVVASVADGILGADTRSAPSGTNFKDDEEFDIESFGKLRALIIPLLGGDAVADKTRKAYAESLFRTSIIHETNSGEKDIAAKADDFGLSSLYAPCPGRTVATFPTQRAQMSYVAFEELFSLVAAKSSASRESDESSAQWVRVASAAAPFLMLRCALTLRSYVADQPLRGKMPQPLSQRKELIWALRKLVELESEADAIPALTGAEGENRKHLLRLYPLMVRALAVGGDDKVLGLLREALEAVGRELGIV